MTSPSAAHPARPEDDSLRLFSKLEIQQILRKIERDQTLLHISASGQDIGVVTTILKVDAAQGIFIIDSAPKQETNLRLQQSRQNQLQTYVDRILIKFDTGPATPCEFDGKPALTLALPQSVHRLQRRRSYRVSVPISNPAIATLIIDDKTWSFPLHDINASGMALHDESMTLEARSGLLVRDVSLYLPGIATLQLDLLFVRAQDETLASGRAVRRIGCTFLDLPGQAQTALQAYISQIERQDIARRRGLL